MTVFCKRLEFVFSSPWDFLISLIKSWDSKFLFFADCEINSLARFTFCIIPYPSPQHFASVIIASASPRAMHSSRSRTALSPFFSAPSPSNNRLASSFFAALFPFVANTSRSLTLCILMFFLFRFRLSVCVKKKRFDQSIMGRKKKVSVFSN